MLIREDSREQKSVYYVSKSLAPEARCQKLEKLIMALVSNQKTPSILLIIQGAVYMTEYPL